MLCSSRVKLSIGRWLFSAGAIVAMAAQLAVAFSQLAEGREGRETASHVEAGGTATHYAHNEATCATCQARTLHGLAIRPSAPLLPVAIHAIASVTAAERIVTAELLSHNNPRAPPLPSRI